MNKIRIIIPYFGKLPTFFNYFLLTAARNKKIDFLIITDQDFSVYKSLGATNIVFKSSTLSDLKQKFQKRFDFKIYLDTPYKLCDYKPAYGYLFQEELKEYDYWGFCDTDVLLGDVYSFLESHDFFANDFARYGLLGHLQIYKNEYDVNTLFKTGIDLGYRLDYRSVFSSKFPFIFDESLGIQKLFERSEMNQLQPIEFDDLDVTSFTFRSGDNAFPRYYYWSKNSGLESIELWGGKFVKRSPLYVHFQKRHVKAPDLIDINHFVVVPNEIVLSDYLSENEMINRTKDRVYWDFKKYSLLKKFKREKWTYGFIRHKLRLRK